MPAIDELTDNPCIFTMRGAVEFSDTQNGEKKKLRLTLYDGSVVPHWYWGNLAFDQKTMKMAKGRNPILFNHDTDQRLAFSDRTEFEPKFIMEGRFLTTSTIAGEVKSQMDEGFPFEASLSFDPDRSRIQFIKEGETDECNGRTVKGPGTIVRNALITEGSVCVFGALKNTKSQAFAENPFFKETAMSKETNTNMTVEELTVATFATACPDLHGKIVESSRAEGVAAEKARFAELQKICGGDAELLVKCFAEGKSAGETSNLRIEKFTAETKRQAEEIAALKAGKVDPAIAEFRNAPAPGQRPDEEPATDEAGWRAQFESSPQLQQEFRLGGVDSYIEFMRADDEGRVRMTASK